MDFPFCCWISRKISLVSYEHEHFLSLYILFHPFEWHQNQWFDEFRYLLCKGSKKMIMYMQQVFKEWLKKNNQNKLHTYGCVANSFSRDWQCKKVHRGFIIRYWHKGRYKWFNFKFRFPWVGSKTSETNNFHEKRFSKIRRNFPGVIIPIWIGTHLICVISIALSP